MKTAGARRKINQSLEKHFGIRITRVRDEPVSPVAADRPDAPASAEPSEPKPKPKPEPAAPADLDPTTIAIARQVKPRTMTGPDKLYALIEATRYVSRNGIEGDIVECGVWRGGGMMAVALTLADVGDTTKDLHLFDTYDGMSEPTEEDRRIRDGQDAKHLLDNSEKDTKTWVWAYASLDDVKEGMASVDYPQDRIHYVVGKVEDTIPEHAPDKISLLRLDTDWYESTKHELEHLYDRLSPGGVIIFDDYGYWEGARKAVDEFIDRTGEKLLLIRIASGRIAVKVNA